jgi:hypothetical protein
MSVLNSITSDPKLQAAQDANRDKLQHMKASYGYPTEEKGSSEPKFKTVKGVKYMRGPNGEAIRVD